MNDSQVSERLGEMMEASHIDVKINCKLISEKLEKRALMQLKKAKFLKNYEKYEEFIASEEWKKMHNDHNAYELLYFYMNELFGHDRSLIYDCGKVIIDKSNLYKDLNKEQKKLLEKVDREKKDGVYKSGNFFVKYIGSTSGTLTEEESEESDESGEKVVEIFW